MIIDAHQHFWNFDPDKHAWINDSMHMLRRNFLPNDLKPFLLNNGIDGCIAVQADQSLEETKFLIGLANQNNWIKAVIGWVDLKSNDIEEQLTFWKQSTVLKGFRHILQAEEPEFMLSTSFLRGIAALQKFNYCYEILIYPKHLSATLLLVKQFPDMRFVIDHIAKPNIKEQQISDWKEGIELLSKQKNVFCKISGLVTEADWKNWKFSDFDPYLNIVINAFGVDRLIYGSDWPVCILAANYNKQYAIYKQYFSDYSEIDISKIFGGNAKKFYQI
jgi:L-fuconolactonase